MIFSDRALSQKLERAEARAGAAFVEARAELFPASGAAWTATAGAYAMFDGIASPLTQTFGLGVFDEATEADLDNLEQFFKQRGAPVLHEVSPLADASLFAMLNERGYQPIEFSSVMYRSLAEEINLGWATNPRIQTRVIKTGEEEIWSQTLAKGWTTETPELFDFLQDIGAVSARCAGAHSFLAEIEGAPVAAGNLFVYDEAAILAGASTVPEFRRQGAQTALLDARLKFARERGCTIAIMVALPGSQSQRNAEKNDFRIAYTRTKWQLKD